MSSFPFLDLANLKLNDSVDSGRHSETQPLLQQPPHPSLGPTPPGIQVPLGSGGSGGSSGQQNVGGIWGATPGNMNYGPLQGQQPVQPMQAVHSTNWDMPWAGPPSGGSGSNTTYGPIYNPAAPPPSATNYVTVPQAYQQGGYIPGGAPTDSSYGYQQQQQPSISSSGN